MTGLVQQCLSVRAPPVVAGIRLLQRGATDRTLLFGLTWRQYREPTTLLVGNNRGTRGLARAEHVCVSARVPSRCRIEIRQHAIGASCRSASRGYFSDRGVAHRVECAHATRSVEFMCRGSRSGCRAFGVAAECASYPGAGRFGSLGGGTARDLDDRHMVRGHRGRPCGLSLARCPWAEPLNGLEGQ